MKRFFKAMLVAAKWLMYMVFLLLAGISLAFVESNQIITLLLLSPIIMYVGIKIIVATVKSKQGVMALLFCAGVVELVWVGTTLSWFYLVVFIFGVLVFNLVNALMALEFRLVKPNFSGSNSDEQRGSSNDGGFYNHYKNHDPTASYYNGGYDGSSGETDSSFSDSGVGAGVDATGSGHTASGNTYAGTW